MNKNALIGIIVAVAVVVSGAVFFLGKDDKSSTNNSASNSANSSSESSDEKDVEHDSKSSKLPAQTVGQQPDCSLYSLEDIAKIWGVPMTDTDVDGTKVSQTGGNVNGKLYSCSYNETDSGTGLSVSIEFRDYDTEAGAIQYIKDRRDGAKFGEKVYFVNDEVQSIGDEAFFSLNKGMADGTAKKVEEQLYARSGKVAFLLTAVNLDGVDATYRDKILETYRLKL